MNRVRRTSPAHRIARAALLLTAAFGVAAYIACSSDNKPYAPLGKNTPPASGAVVAGNVSDASHTPVGKAVVVMEPLTNGVPQTALWLKNQAEAGGKLALPATSDISKLVTLTDEKGRYAFSGVKAGEYSIQVRADDHLGASYKVDVPQALLTLDTIIVNVNLTPTGTFSGVATLENGALLPTTHSNIVVYCQGTSYVAVTDATGAYALTDVPVGTYTIRATKSHYRDDSKIGTLTFAGQNLGLPAMLLKIDNNIAPVATITIPVQPMVANVPISFQASGSDLDGSVVLYEWDWENDGTMDASSASPGSTNHTYATPGNYTVKLRVTDNQGAIGLDAKVVTVVADAIYMATTGSDTNAGTQVSPVLTLTKAYQLAQLNGVTNVRAALGTYGQTPNFLNGINVTGGYDASWAPDVGYTKFNVGTNRAIANSITSATTIHRVEIATTSQVLPANSTALLSQGCTLALVFDNCIFRASNAGPAGSAGFTGGAGNTGGAGVGGGNGACDTDGNGGVGGSGGTSSVCPGGAGGKGGATTTGPLAVAGSPGSCGGGAGGSAGPSGDPGSPGGNGTQGVNGTYGTLGPTASATGSIVGTNWVPALGGNGAAGTDGRGGGGGGGGGAQTCTFCDDGQGNGGGGGGGAGSAGGGGNGGPSGYGSIAILLIASSPTFQNCQIFTANGSAGANGGAGGDGGLGGAGGTGPSVCAPSEVGKGGNGGKGGDAGGGGGGAGGAGGPSIGIIRASGSAPNLSAVAFNLGTAGGGGSGGITGKLAGVNGAPAPNGPTGVQANTLNL